MACVGNLTCRDCGLTFIARWGSYEGLDEYRCRNDHVVLVGQSTGAVVAVDGAAWPSGTLADHRGRCPGCGADLGTGLLPCCPICGGRDHDVAVAGTIWGSPFD